MRMVSSAGRASPLQGEGHWFEPSTIHHNVYIVISRGWLAQLGEHRPYKARVTGSSPVPSTILRSRLFPGWLAQLGEHRPYKARVTGSIPVPSTIILARPLPWMVSSAGRASPLQGEGHWFDPSTIHHNSSVIPIKPPV